MAFGESRTTTVSDRVADTPDIADMGVAQSLHVTQRRIIPLGIVPIPCDDSLHDLACMTWMELGINVPRVNDSLADVVHGDVAAVMQGQIGVFTPVGFPQYPSYLFAISPEDDPIPAAVLDLSEGLNQHRRLPKVSSLQEPCGFRHSFLAA